MPTGIWSSRLRSGSAHWDLDCEEEAAGEEAEEAEVEAGEAEAEEEELAGVEKHRINKLNDSMAPWLWL